MKVIVFVYKPTPEQESIVQACLSFLGVEFQVYNISNYKPEDLIESNSVIVTFGRQADLAVKVFLSEQKKVTGVKHESLPSLGQLEKKEQNKVFREKTLEKLDSLKKYIEEDKFQPVIRKITEEDLPDLDKKHLLLLKKITEEAGRDSVFQTTKGGKLIEISSEPLEKSSADIHLSFSEIYTIRLLMDTLQVKAVDLVFSPNPSILRSDKSDSKKTT